MSDRIRKVLDAQMTEERYERLSDPLFALGYLLNIIEAHEQANRDVNDLDNLLYWAAEQAASRVNRG